ncbi:MAG: enoyl-CoA hydratase/isomerase family protein [Betaproteobacteria bacterium]|jgi:2-(1,2-epoxy-1,2-dihydrophenyl)acetyl-CoA isomerase|nr:enoyl-CoA hydratase/isomerase family protein [Betaproteobacteria bacterium]MBK8107084.1 enoyl-CoA hydratase/isomerase family protein [Betaproteobacteria bacterium]
MTDTLLSARRGGVLQLTLNRPDKLNAIDLPLLDALTVALETAGGDPEVRAIVLAGAGRAFCAGADIGQMIERTPDDWERTVDHYLDPIRVIARIGKPVIARLHGNVFGGGLGLALACDFRVAAADARLCTPFVKLALAGCDMSAGYYLPRLVGLGRATDMMMTARVVEAPEALAIGLVSQLAPADGLDAAVDALADKLAAFAPRTTAFTKAAIRRSLDRDMEGEFDYEIFAQVQCLQSADHREGVAAFRERRAPVFRGV